MGLFTNHDPYYSRLVSSSQDDWYYDENIVASYISRTRKSLQFLRDIYTLTGILHFVLQVKFWKLPQMTQTSSSMWILTKIVTFDLFICKNKNALFYFPLTGHIIYGESRP